MINMKYFVQFKNQNKTDLLGSDGIFKLDARKNLDSMINDAYIEMHKFRNIKPSLKYFQIRKGNLRNSRVVYKNY